MVFPPRETSARNKIKLAYLGSHPIQYQAPLLRRISQEPDIDLTVFYGSDFSVRGYKDKGFGVGVKWEVPLLDGYRYELLPKLRDTNSTGIARPLNYGIASRLRGRRGEPRFDALGVHGYHTINALQAMIAAKGLGVPVLLRAESWLGDRSRSAPKLAARQLFSKALEQLVDAVLPIGSRNTDYWKHYFGPDFPMFLMPYAVDNDDLRRRSVEAQLNRTQLQEELNLDPSRPVILFASKLQRRKRCSDLLEAFRTLPVQSFEKPPCLVIVGDGEERAELERKAKEHNLTEVRFCGFRNQSELPRFFDLASVFVLPSQHEPWGLIVNEVMNAARAVIVSNDVGCQPDLIRDDIEDCVYPAGRCFIAGRRGPFTPGGRRCSALSAPPWGPTATSIPGPESGRRGISSVPIRCQPLTGLRFITLLQFASALMSFFRSNRSSAEQPTTTTIPHSLSSHSR